MYILLVAMRRGQTSELLFAQISVSDHVLPDLKFWSGDDKNLRVSNIFWWVFVFEASEKKKKKRFCISRSIKLLYSLCALSESNRQHIHTITIYEVWDMELYRAPGKASSPANPVLTLRPALPLYKEEYAEVKCQPLSRNVLLLSAVGVLSWSISFGLPSL